MKSDALWALRCLDIELLRCLDGTMTNDDVSNANNANNRKWAQIYYVGLSVSFHVCAVKTSILLIVNGYSMYML